ncbi:MAG TPA: PEP-CTERM sorting domain-containing protein [Bryobacteraceae bacterium]|nr:PEP-CTERM sorting domain-containing protein [Bryobacteraceae bacterium]
MSPYAFVDQGILFNNTYFVGFVQGENALVPPGTSTSIGGSFDEPITTISVTVAQGFAESGDYSLTVFDSSGVAVASTTMTTPVTGYSTISLTGFSPTAISFLLENNASVSPPYNEFALGSVDFNQTPEPSTWFLAAIGLAVFVCSSRWLLGPER